MDEVNIECDEINRWDKQQHFIRLNPPWLYLRSSLDHSIIEGWLLFIVRHDWIDQQDIPLRYTLTPVFFVLVLLGPLINQRRMDIIINVIDFGIGWKTYLFFTRWDIVPWICPIILLPQIWVMKISDWHPVPLPSVLPLHFIFPHFWFLKKLSSDDLFDCIILPIIPTN